MQYKRGLFVPRISVYRVHLLQYLFSKGHFDFQISKFGLGSSATWLLGINPTWSYVAIGQAEHQLRPLGQEEHQLRPAGLWFPAKQHFIDLPCGMSTQMLGDRIIFFKICYGHLK